MVIPSCCFMIHVYIFDLILSLSLLLCPDTSTSDISTVTAQWFLKSKLTKLIVFLLQLEHSADVRNELSKLCHKPVSSAASSCLWKAQVKFLY